MKTRALLAIGLCAVFGAVAMAQDCSRPQQAYGIAPPVSYGSTPYYGGPGIPGPAPLSSIYGAPYGAPGGPDCSQPKVSYGSVYGDVYQSSPAMAAAPVMQAAPMYASPVMYAASPVMYASAAPRPPQDAAFVGYRRVVVHPSGRVKIRANGFAVPAGGNAGYYGYGGYGGGIRLAVGW